MWLLIISSGVFHDYIYIERERVCIEILLETWKCAYHLLSPGNERLLCRFGDCDRSYYIQYRKTVLSPPARWGSLDVFMIVSDPPPSSPPAASDLNCEFWISVCTAGRQLRAPDFSGHWRTSTGSQCALPDRMADRPPDRMPEYIDVR